MTSLVPLLTLLGIRNVFFFYRWRNMTSGICHFSFADIIWNLELLFHCWFACNLEYVLVPLLASLDIWIMFLFHCWLQLIFGLCSCSIVGLTWYPDYVLVPLLASVDIWIMFLLASLDVWIVFLFHCWLTCNLEYVLVLLLASLDIWIMFLFHCWPHLISGLCSCSIVGLIWYLDYVLVLQPPWHLDSRRAGV